MDKYIPKTIKNRVLIRAHSLGYRVTEGGVLKSPSGGERNSHDSGGYPFVTLRVPEKASIGVHRLAAFQKFGFAIFGERVEVRHLDGNPWNNSPDNLELGTKKENEADKSRANIMKSAIAGALSVRKFDDSTLVKIRNYKGNRDYSYKRLSKMFDLPVSCIHRAMTKEYKTYERLSMMGAQGGNMSVELGIVQNLWDEFVKMSRAVDNAIDDEAMSFQLLESLHEVTADTNETVALRADLFNAGVKIDGYCGQK